MKTGKSLQTLLCFVIISILASCTGADKDIIEKPEDIVEVVPETPAPQTPKEENTPQEIHVILPESRLSLTEEQKRNITPGNDFSFLLFDKAIHTPEFGSEEMGNRISYDVSNLFFSPLSIQFTLGMLGNYVKNEESLSEMLGFEKADIGAVNEYFKTIRKGLTEDESNSFIIANALMRDTLSIPFKEDFTNVLKANYDIDYLCFEAKSLEDLPKGSRPEDIWIKEKTGGMIDSAPMSILREEFSLFNTLCFKGEWDDKFNAELTKDDTFHKDDKTDIIVKMMHKKKPNCYFYQDSVFSSVSLPLCEDSYLMTILLPKEGKEVTDITGTMDSKGWDALRHGLTFKTVDMSIPKFSSAFSHYNLLNLLDEKYRNEYLEELDRMYDEDPKHTHLFNTIAQKASFTIDENGAAAAVASQAGMASAPEPGETIVFKADHPFVYVISDAGSGLVLFIGTFSGKANVN